MTTRTTLGVLAGGVAGFVVGFVLYTQLGPVLEDASGWVRETQGLLWNAVPLLTVLGALVGGLLARRRPGG